MALPRMRRRLEVVTPHTPAPGLAVVHPPDPWPSGCPPPQTPNLAVVLPPTSLAHQLYTPQTPTPTFVYKTGVGGAPPTGCIPHHNSLVSL